MVLDLFVTPAERVTALLWLATMIAVPIISRRGRHALGISLGVIAQVLLILTLLIGTYGIVRTMLTAVGVAVLGWFAEFVGSRTGVPFGPYHYTPALRPQIARVPVVIPAAWLMMLPAAWGIGEAVLPGAPAWQRALIAAGAFTAWDVYLDPQMVKWDFWRWPNGGWYYGIPFSNFVGWFAWGFVITMVVQPAPLPAAPFVFIYVVTWLLEFGGQMVFWGLPKAAIAGFLTMGLFVLAALV